MEFHKSISEVSISLTYLNRIWKRNIYQRNEKLMKSIVDIILKFLLAVWPRTFMEPSLSYCFVDYRQKLTSLFSLLTFFLLLSPLSSSSFLAPLHLLLLPLSLLLLFLSQKKSKSSPGLRQSPLPRFLYTCQLQDNSWC